MTERVAIQITHPQFHDEIVPKRPEVVTVDDFGAMEVSSFAGDASATPWVQLLPWSEHPGRPDALARHGAMADMFGADLYTVATPGVGFATASLTKELRRQVNAGNLEPLAEIQWEALKKARDGQLGRLSVLGYSMGTALASAFIRTAPSDASIERVVLVEPVANIPVNLRSLGRKLVHDSISRADYRSSNPEWFRHLAKPMPPQKRDLLTFSQMIGRGGQFEQLPRHLGDARATIISGDKSTVTPIEGVPELAKRLGAEQWVLEGENHSFIDNLGRIAGLCRYISEN